jgi:sulfhydrogenase subunit delta
MAKKKYSKIKKTIAKKVTRAKTVKRVIVSAKKAGVTSNQKRSVMEDKVKKPKIAIVSLTSCEGCQFVLLDLGQRFLDLVNQVEMVDFRLLEDEEDKGDDLDLVLVEGNPITEDNFKLLLSARKRAKILVAMGNCAAMGGIPEIKNYHEEANTIKHVYKYLQGIKNPPIQEIDNFVKVDFTFPGCPITGEEFLKYIPELIKGNIPKIPDQPVCLECQKKGNRCMLLDKKPCFGPMILGGCDAVCPTARMMCQGCRGLRPAGNVAAMRSTLKNMMTDEEFENVSEIYGLRDDLEAYNK